MSLAHKIMKSSVWVYLSRWLVKLCGITSTIILARILTTDDFGIVATIAIVTSLFHVLTETGARKYLLRKKVITDDELNTAWTIGIFMRLLVAVGTFVVAEPAAIFFNDERLIEALRVSAFIPLIASFGNIGMIRHQKAMNFKPQFKLDVNSQVLTLVVKVTLALYLQSYWAFILAEIAHVIIRLSITYILHPFRPKLGLNNWRDQWNYSRWVLGKGIFSSIRFKIDNIVIAKFFPASSLGLYTVAKDVATTPVGQIVTPMIQPLYVGLAEHLSEPAVFSDKLQKTILSSLFLIFPISFGISALAENIVVVLLGEKWLGAIVIIQILAFVIVSGMLSSLMTEILNLLGKTKANFYLDIFLGVITIGVFIIFARKINLDEFALIRVLLGFFSFIVIIVYVRLVSNISLIRLILISIPVLSCAVYMFFTVNYLNHLMEFDYEVVKLFLLVGIGFLIYAIACLIVVRCLKNYIHEFDFVWKTIFFPVLKKLQR